MMDIDIYSCTPGDLSAIRRLVAQAGFHWARYQLDLGIKHSVFDAPSYSSTNCELFDAMGWDYDLEDFHSMHGKHAHKLDIEVPKDSGLIHLDLYIYDRRDGFGLLTNVDVWGWLYPGTNKVAWSLYKPDANTQLQLAVQLEAIN